MEFSGLKVLLFLPKYLKDLFLALVQQKNKI